MKKLSAWSIGTYTQCERKFIYQQDRYPVDCGYSTPAAFTFGRAFHEAIDQEDDAFEDVIAAIGSDYRQMKTSIVLEIAAKHELNTVHTGKLLACLRSYFERWPRSNIIAREKWLNGSIELTGRVDSILQDDTGIWIVETKTTSSISPTFILEKMTDVQCALYCHLAANLFEDCGLDYSLFRGVKYRVVEKPRQTLLKACKKRAEEETAIDYSLRCDKPRVEEFDVHASVVDVAGMLKKCDQIRLALSQKNEVSDFCQNLNACKTFGQLCEYHTTCHGFNANLDDDSNVDF